MFKALYARMRQGYRTIQFPKGKPPELPDRFRGRPVFQTGKCKAGCTVCVDTCPVGAISGGDMLSIDLGKCLFCTDCERACPEHAISFQNDYRLSVRSREDLILSDKDTTMSLAQELDASMKRLFGRSLKLRQVSAGGCNACEADVNVLGTIGWDLGRFGIQFVASPRHADGLLITGPVTGNMELALRKAYDAVPDPKIVIVVGACAISGGPYSGHPEANDGALSMFPVDLFIPGCPPHPLTILDGLLRLLGRIDDTRLQRLQSGN
ncbi:MAG TPA: 4Fe-4S binding protein [bacterium]|nr:4Fe-4S binding protein [bacterium]